MVMNQLKTVALLGVLSSLLIGVGGALGSGFFYFSIVLALVMNVGAYFFSDKLVLRMSGAREVSPAEAPELHALVTELSEKAGLPKPRVCVIPESQPNAFATGRNPAHGVVAVTEGLLARLDKRELRGVLAHELAHIANRDILVASVAAVFASAISSIGNMLMWSSMFGGRDEEGDGGGGILMALVAPIAATMVQLGISRSREYLADETAARLTGDPEALARALEKLHQAAQVVPADVRPATASLYIVSPFASAGRRLGALFSTHPPAEERIARLRALAEVLQPGPVSAPRVAYRSF